MIKTLAFRLSFWGFRLARWCCAKLPFWLLYWLSDWSSWIMYRILQYRTSVVAANLSIAFPEKSAAEKAQIARSFYRQLVDVGLETLKGSSLSDSEIKRRFRFVNPELVNKRLHDGEAVFLLLGHCGNWEWGPLAAPHFLSEPMVGIYKPLKNRLINGYLNELRATWGGLLSPMSQTGRFMVRYRGQPLAYSFIADQTPSDVDNAHWVDFFGRETAFHHGFSKLANRTNYHLYYTFVRRKARGYYEVEFMEMGQPSDFPNPLAITQAYAALLTKNIRQAPADWLWSHRRWKRQRGTKAVIAYHRESNK